MYLYVNLADLYLRLFVWLFYFDFSALYHSSELVAVVADDIRDDQFDSLPSIKLDGVPLVVVEESSAYLWHNRWCANLSFPNVQISLLQSHL